MIPAIEPTCAVAIVDRVEDDIAVVEWCGVWFTDLPLTALPPGTSEGDALRLVVIPSRAPNPAPVDTSVGRRDGTGQPGAQPHVEQESPHAIH